MLRMGETYIHELSEDKVKMLSIGRYSVMIQEEPDYCFGSGDTKYYDDVIDLVGNEDYTKTISIQVNTDYDTNGVALIVPYFVDVNRCALPAGECLFLMLNTTLCLFDLATMKIRKQNKIDSMGTMFEAYAYKQDFILYGETDIFRISEDLSILWEFSGRDIFVRHKSYDPAFVMKSDRICLYDFEEKYYEIDYDGNILNSSLSN